MIARLRDLTRYRKKLVEARSSETQRIQKLLEDAGIKLDSVVSDVLGKSGRDMLDALIAGVRDPRILAEMARARMRPKIAELHLALEGRFSQHHALMLEMHLAHVDHLTASIERLDGEIDEVMTPFGDQSLRFPLHPRRRQAHRRGHCRGDRRRHEPLPHRRAPGVMGRDVPRQP